MRFTNQQLTLWYGTVDAPAPIAGTVDARRGVSVTVGVQPPGVSNVVSVQYRVDEGPLQVAPGVRLRTDYDRGIEYHRTVLPDLPSGERVSYVPVVSCAGRSAPDLRTATALPSSFRLPDAETAARGPATPENPPPAARGDRTLPTLTYLASIRVPLNKPEIIGVTPAGLLVNWFWSPNEGTAIGPQLKAKVRMVGGDWMNIRRDGIGMMDVRATVETEEGALAYVTYLGTCDFGENGYQDFLEGRWPDRAPTRTSPRIFTAHSKYLWLNRLSYLGAGAVRMKELIYEYDLYALPIS